jgi:nicotinamidase-related amidase
MHQKISNYEKWGDHSMSTNSERRDQMSTKPAKDTSILGKSPVLLVIDVQHDFMDSDGAVPCPATSAAGGPKEVIANIHRLVNAAKISHIPTIFTKETHRPSLIDMGRELDGDEPRHCIDETKGTTILEELGAYNLADNQYLVPKRRYSAFIGTDLVFLLNAFKADTLVLTGAATNVCVHYTGADAHQYDYRIKVVEEATAGTSPEAHRAALQSLEYLQHGAIVHLGEVVEAMKSFVFPQS